MSRHFVGLTMATILCLSASLAHGQRGGERSRGNESRGGSSEQRGSEGKEGNREGGREGESKQGGNSAPGGDWSERSHSGKQSNGQANNQRGESGPGNAAQKNSNQTSGKDAAGAAAYKSNQQPQATGKEGAAAGAAAENKNQPQYSGAQGAAAGAAAANKNQPQYSGAQGAAAGAAAANKNQPQYYVAPGAAAANTTQPQYTAAPGATAGGMAAPGAQYPAATTPPTGAVTANYPVATAPANMPTVAANAPPPTANVPSTMGAVAADYAKVRSTLRQSPVYSQQWCLDHPGSWFPTGWVPKAAWNATQWGALSDLCGYGDVTPISYDYGVNVTALDGNVYVNGQNVGTTGAFSQQAAETAWAGAAAEVSTADEWLPLGVFAMVRDERQQPQLIVQLAINKQGILRGNYTDILTDHDSPIRGTVNKQSQRAAWIVGDNKQIVMEVGLKDLTDNEAPALIHKNGKTDHWLLIRLMPPQAGPN